MSTDLARSICLISGGPHHCRNHFYRIKNRERMFIGCPPVLLLRLFFGHQNNNLRLFACSHASLVFEMNV